MCVYWVVGAVTIAEFEDGWGIANVMTTLHTARPPTEAPIKPCCTPCCTLQAQIDGHCTVLVTECGTSAECLLSERASERGIDRVCVCRDDFNSAAALCEHVPAGRGLGATMPAITIYLY